MILKYVVSAATLCLLCSCRVAMAQSWFIAGLGDIYRMSASAAEFIKDSSYCVMFECCPYIRVDNELYRNLTLTLFGQHIVIGTVVKSLKSHYESGSRSKKPLVLSFHGPAGTGKNFVADRIADFLYTNGGVESKFVYKFRGRVDFPLDSKVNEYKTELYHTVLAALQRCPRSLFIFDEVDKMPEGLFDMMKSLLDYHSGGKRVNTREAVYIFLSNAGGLEISHKLLELIESGTTREETSLADFDPILLVSAYNENGGLKNTHMIQSHLIDHFVPFLPLEQRHVLKCIEAEFVSQKRIITRSIVEDILKEIVYQWDIFATSGCKRLSKLVGLLAH